MFVYGRAAGCRPYRCPHNILSHAERDSSFYEKELGGLGDNDI